MASPLEALREHVGWEGRLLAASKGRYRDRYPNHEVYFNACAFVDGEQVWWGDVDLTLESPRLQAAADACGRAIEVTPEMPYRFEGRHPKGGSINYVPGASEDLVRRFEPGGAA